ncbi:hypothetical protein L1887_24647 [Cichorium endivia]|nr:hypothetical protein L1887_24647 [Cichorium endivia]
MNIEANHDDFQSPMLGNGFELKKDSELFVEPKDNVIISPTHVSPLNEAVKSHLSAFEPNQSQMAQAEKTENKLNLEDCSDTLKVLLSKDTPIKEKLRFVANEKKFEQNKGMGDLPQNHTSEMGQFQTRITRSQVKRYSLRSDSKTKQVSGEAMSVDSSISVGISSRIDEVGELCGFKKGGEKLKGRILKKNSKKGDVSKTQ